MKYKERDKLVSSLRELADYLETPRAMELPSMYLGIQVYADQNEYKDGKYQINARKTKAKLARIAKALAPCKKDFSGSSFEIVRNFGEIRLRVTASRDAVCKKVPTGRVIVHPPYAAPGYEEEEFEWKCSPSLLK